MGVEVAATCLHWSQPVVSHQSPCCQRLASAISSPSFRKTRRSFSDQALSCRVVSNRWNRSSSFLGHTKFIRSPSCEVPEISRPNPLRRAFSASLDGFSDEEFAKQIQELALRFDEMDEEDEYTEPITDGGEASSFDEPSTSNNNNNNFSCYHPSVHTDNRPPFPISKKIGSVEPPWVSVRPEPPDWPQTDQLAIPSSLIERKANSVDLPLSLRLIKKKNQWQEGFREAGESAYCSVKKAFSSMVFIIRELHSYSLQMREALFYEDLQGILGRVHREMHASFVWLFQQIFSHTPTLMVYVMILLANFTVHSMAHNAAIAAATPPITPTATETSIQQNQNQSKPNFDFDSSSFKTSSVSSSSSGKLNNYSVGGGNGGGGKVRSTSSGTDGGDGQFNPHHQIVPDETTTSSSFGNQTAEKKSVEDEVRVWNSIVEEAWSMRAASMDESLDQETMQRFVSPVTVEMEQESYDEQYLRTELMYQLALAQDPHNSLLLSNYAQFLYLVVHDHDRAEEYFKRAVEVKPADAEALQRYATFLWLGRKDMCAAEETFLEAIEADPGNTYHAANYAHFLWNTGGEDTCFPLSPPDEDLHNAA